MTVSLSSQNVIDYLIEQGLCTLEEQAQSKIEPKEAKNFNLLVSSPEGRKLLIKQERRNREGKTAGEFLREWRIQEFLQQFPELSQIRPLISEATHFDAEQSIIVFNYLNDYRDLMDFYGKENLFPIEIATAIGSTLATIHRLTLDHQPYKEFFLESHQDGVNTPAPYLVGKLDRIGPEIYGLVPADGLKFFALYQRYDSLGQAIAELTESVDLCCLTHNDLKLNNILLSTHWEQVISQTEQSSFNPLSVTEVAKDGIVRFIDWERSNWGDPAFDLGTLLSSYLQFWLASLITSKTISIDESLRMATTPLETLQPSIAALAIAYFTHFPEILERRPDFLRRVVQFAGLTLIQAIQATLQYQKSFGNTGICMLQVAKYLLCRPEPSISTIFGMDASALIRTSYVDAKLSIS